MQVFCKISCNLIINRLRFFFCKFLTAKLFKMTTILALILGAAGGMWMLKRITAKSAANFQAAFYSTFTGVYPVFPESPWDDTVDARAAELEAGFTEHGNHFPRQIQPYYYNSILGGSQSTASLDFQNCMVLFTRDYLNRVEQFHAKQYAADPKATNEHLAGQRPVNLNTL